VEVSVKRHVYRIGDTVRIVNPRWIERVGYPLVWYNLLEEVQRDLKVGQAWDVLNGRPPRGAPPEVKGGLFGVLQAREPTHGVPRYFLQAAAKALVEQRGFGGNERQIFYVQDLPENCGQRLKLEVLGKRVVKTGTRFPASYHQYDDGDGEPGGLDNEKTHIILRTSYGEIEACNVEPITGDQK
jgi:hypothetical protein